MDKKLLRKIKQEGIDLSSKSEIDEEEYTKYLEEYYHQSNKKDYSDWTTNEVLTRLQELQHLSYVIYSKYPHFYYNCFYFSILNGEYYSILDEIDDRYSSYYHHRHELDYNP